MQAFTPPCMGLRRKGVRVRRDFCSVFLPRARARCLRPLTWDPACSGNVYWVDSIDLTSCFVQLRSSLCAAWGGRGKIYCSR